MEILDQIIAFLGSAEAKALIIAGVADFIFRLLPTKKPLGVAHLIIAIIKKVIVILEKIVAISDKVLPQNTKE